MLRVRKNRTLGRDMILIYLNLDDMQVIFVGGEKEVNDQCSNLEVFRSNSMDSINVGGNQTRRLTLNSKQV